MYWFYLFFQSYWWWKSSNRYVQLDSYSSSNWESHVDYTIYGFYLYSSTTHCIEIILCCTNKSIARGRCRSGFKLLYWSRFCTISSNGPIWYQPMVMDGYQRRNYQFRFIIFKCNETLCGTYHYDHLCSNCIKSSSRA